MRISVIVSACLLMFALAGCTAKSGGGSDSIQNVTVTSLEKDLISGVTTKADVEKKFGTPSSIRKNIEFNGKTNCDEWKYVFNLNETDTTGSKLGMIGFLGTLIPGADALRVATNSASQAGGVYSSVAGSESKMESKMLFIVFDKRGKVISYQLESHDYTNQM